MAKTCTQGETEWYRIAPSLHLLVKVGREPGVAKPTRRARGAHFRPMARGNWESPLGMNLTFMRSTVRTGTCTVLDPGKKRSSTGTRKQGLKEYTRLW